MHSVKQNSTISSHKEKSDTKINRICLTLDLKNDLELIRKYTFYHSPEGHWMEIAEGIRQTGIVVMDIYKLDNRLFMICEVPEDVDFDFAWNSMSNYPKQPEWAKLMRIFQQAVPGHNFGWIKMERIYTLY